MTKLTVLKHPYVFVVLEHALPEIDTDAKVLGIYTTREAAEGKVIKYQFKNHKFGVGGYLSILKKPLQGPKVKAYESDFCGINTLVVDL